MSTTPHLGTSTDKRGRARGSAERLTIKAKMHELARERLVALGEQIRRARVARDLSAARMAEQVGVNRDTISAIERGDTGVALGTTVSVLIALQMPPACLDALAGRKP